MNGTIDDRYFEWLYSQIGAVRDRSPSRTYWSLTRQLYSTPFTWFVRNDDNRVEDGLELRREFIDMYGPEGIDPDWAELECSVFEMLLALCRRVSFQSEKTSSDWFWTCIDNLDLRGWSDRRYNEFGAEVIADALTRLIDRTYREDGLGGLFPLQHPHQDQRRIEIWDQASAYLLEGEFADVAPY